MLKGVGAHTSHLLQYGFFTFLFVGTIVLAFFVFKPFLPTIFLALILAVVCHPFYRQTIRAFGGHEKLAAYATLLILLALIIVPALFFGLLLFREVIDMYGYFTSAEGMGNLSHTVQALEDGIRSIFPSFAGIDQYADVEMYIERGLGWVAENFTKLFGSTFSMLLKLILMFIAFSYFLREGEAIIKKLILLSPLKNAHDEMILKKIALSINAVLKGRLALGVIQGAFAGVGFALFGVPHPVFLGFLTAFCSLVPMLGTALVVAPAVLYLFFTGAFAASVGLMAWGAIAVGLIDDILGPLLIERGMKIHPFLILISVLGGLEFFGLIGFIAGPVVLAVLFVLGEIYIRITRPLSGSSHVRG